jgi:hypothetical protein
MSVEVGQKAPDFTQGIFRLFVLMKCSALQMIGQSFVKLEQRF